MPVQGEPDEVVAEFGAKVKQRLPGARVINWTNGQFSHSVREFVVVWNRKSIRLHYVPDKRGFEFLGLPAGFWDMEMTVGRVVDKLSK